MGHPLYRPNCYGWGGEKVIFSAPWFLLIPHSPRMRFKPRFSAVLQIFFVGGRLRLFCGRSRKGYVLIAINTVPSRSSRYIAVSAQNRGLNRISGKVMLVYVIGAFYILMMTV